MTVPERLAVSLLCGLLGAFIGWRTGQAWIRGHWTLADGVIVGLEIAGVVVLTIIQTTVATR